MGKDVIIKNKRCRLFVEGGFYVSDDGTFAADRVTQAGLPITINQDGEKTVTPGGFCTYTIAEAILNCYHKRKRFKPGRWYERGYLDGNKLNCHYQNVYWMPNYLRDFMVIGYSGGQITIRQDGTVDGLKNEFDKLTLTPEEDLIKGPDFQYYLFHKGYGNPMVMDVDELMISACFVRGDYEKQSDPVVLHKDNDYTNFTSENLEWCERSDPRYQAYMLQKAKDGYTYTFQPTSKRVWWIK